MYALCPNLSCTGLWVSQAQRMYTASSTIHCVEDSVLCRIWGEPGPVQNVMTVWTEAAVAVDQSKLSQLCVTPGRSVFFFYFMVQK